MSSSSELSTGDSTRPTAKADWTLVVAVSLNGVIGRGSALPWRLSSDLQRFKSLTMGHCLLMGRKTFQSIGKPLPGRQTVVLSRGQFFCSFPEVTVVDRLEKVPQIVQPGRQVMVVGGAQIYEAALPWCNQIWITRVQANIQGDTYLPAIDWSQWQRVFVQAYPAGPKDQWPTEFEQWQRR